MAGALANGQSLGVGNPLTNEVSAARYQKRVILDNLWFPQSQQWFATGILRFRARGELDMVRNGYNRCFVVSLRCKFAVSE